jgi:hypothetical protein
LLLRGPLLALPIVAFTQPRGNIQPRVIFPTITTSAARHFFAGGKDFIEVHLM